MNTSKTFQLSILALVFLFAEEGFAAPPFTPDSQPTDWLAGPPRHDIGRPEERQ